MLGNMHRIPKDTSMGSAWLDHLQLPASQPRGPVTCNAGTDLVMQKRLRVLTQSRMHLLLITTRRRLRVSDADAKWHGRIV